MTTVWTRAREAMQAVSSLFVVLGGIYAVSTALTGGFTPQTQVAASELKSQVVDVQKTVNDIKARVDQLPRPSDYVDTQTHLARIDATFGAVGDRLTHDEIAAAETATQVKRLIDGTNAPLRSPR